MGLAPSVGAVFVMADLRSRILAAIDRLQTQAKPVDAVEVMRGIGWGDANNDQRIVSMQLRDMAKAGLVVYDRKASGWRRA